MTVQRKQARDSAQMRREEEGRPRGITSIKHQAKAGVDATLKHNVKEKLNDYLSRLAALHEQTERAIQHLNTIAFS